jgi:nocardicin N-oxygenase
LTVTERQVRSFPFLPLERLDIEPIVTELRRTEPISRIKLPYGGEAWLVTRYRDVKDALGDPRFSRAAVVNKDVPRRQELPVGPEGIMYMDPPEHTRLRRLITRVFTARRVQDLRPRAQQIADGLVDRMTRGRSSADLVESFALPLPTMVICELLGVPFGDRELFRRGADALMSSHEFTPQEYVRELQGLSAYFLDLIAQRRRQPTDDLLGALVRARDDKGRLTEMELVSLSITLLAGGHETTAGQITNFVYTLLRHPAEMAMLQAQPELLPGAVDELMRYIALGSGHHAALIATEPLELGGVAIAEGDAVFVHLNSGNKDEDEFTDPECLDVTRAHNPHLGFGHGAHYCPGAQLAKMELQVALNTVLNRLPALRLDAEEDAIQWKASMLVRGPQSLWVRW